MKWSLELPSIFKLSICHSIQACFSGVKPFESEKRQNDLPFDETATKRP
jgi:hypothetical protein